MRAPEYSGGVDIAGSLAAVEAGQHIITQYFGRTMLKFPADLDRYAYVIAHTHPVVIVETGTYHGASAGWFADRPGVELVISIDRRRAPVAWPGVTFLAGRSSTDPAVVNEVRSLVAGRRCMVTLDSNHSAPHVAAEIAAYAPLVTPGCYLVVEDGLFDYASAEQLARWGMPELAELGGPMQAIETLLGNDPMRWATPQCEWDHDWIIEGMYGSISQNPRGWWVRR